MTGHSSLFPKPEVCAPHEFSVGYENVTQKKISAMLSEAAYNCNNADMLPYELDIIVSENGRIVLVNKHHLQMLIIGKLTRVIGSDSKAKQPTPIDYDNVLSFKSYSEILPPNTLLCVLEAAKSYCLPSGFMRGFFPGVFTHGSIKKSKVFALNPYMCTRADEGIFVTYRHGVDLDAVFEAKKLINRTASSGWSSVIERNISEKDIALIENWTNGDLDVASVMSQLKTKKMPPSLRRYVFARAAEKFVLRILSSDLKLKAEDVSLMQIEGSDTRWKTHDIEAGIPIDVKNMTVYTKSIDENFSRMGNYLDRFKRYNTADVEIAGVCTRITSDPDDIQQIFLGFVNQRNWKAITDAVNSLTGNESKIAMNFNENFVPGWAFDFPECNPDYNIINEWLPLLSRRPGSTLFSSIATNTLSTNNQFLQLNSAQKNICIQLAQLCSVTGFNKLTISMFSISLFINSLVKGVNPGSAISFLRRTLVVDDISTNVRHVYFPDNIDGERQLDKLPSDTPSHAFSLDIKQSNVGCLYDPISALDNLLKLLDKCGRKISLKDKKFTQFNVSHPYVLQAKEDSGEIYTLYAFCGGKNEKGFSCLEFPLIMGENETCSECRRLVCHKCNFCCDGCI